MDGVWPVDLAALIDGSLLEYQIAQALGIYDQTDRGVQQVVADYLRDRQVLLILDTCEHLLDACAGFADRALRAAGGLRLLCTSRQPLGMIGEHIFTVPPLPVPDPDRPPTSRSAATYPAVTLFVERAAAVAPGFAMTAKNRASIVEICRRLDGLPLAIELAAARVRTLPLEVIEAQLRERSEALTGESPLTRHRSLGAAFDWSYALCSPAERVLWTRISVFAHSLVSAAAEYVCSGDGLAPDQVVTALAGLVDKSVVTVDGYASDRRYRLLDTVREYGLDRLRTLDDGHGSDEAGLQRRHRDWFMALAERFDADWFGPRQPQWTHRMHAEHANLRTALQYCLTSADQGQAALQLAGALTYFWWGCGAAGEGHYWLERALVADPQPSPHRLRALVGYSRLLIVRGEHAAASTWARQCLEQAERLNEPSYIARSLNNLGASLALSADPATSRPPLEEAVDRFNQIGGTDPEMTFAKMALAQPLIAAVNRTEPPLCSPTAARCAGPTVTGGGWPTRSPPPPTPRRCSATRRRPADTPKRPCSCVVTSTTRSASPQHGAVGLLAAANYDYPRAAWLLGAADRQWRIIGQRMYGGARWLVHHQDCEHRTRHALGDTAFRARFRRGAARTLHKAIAQALADRPAAPESA
jgi:predicted ATPase